MSISLLAALATSGMMLLIVGSRRWPQRLKTALAGLDDDLGVTASSDAYADSAWLVDSAAGQLERWAANVFQKWRLPLGEKSKQCLAQQGRSVGDLFAAKLVLALAGLIVPTLVAGMAWLMGLIDTPWPLGVSAVGAVAGYLWPDWQLHRSASAWQQHSADAISVYFDLVTLIRLGNASAVQALREAAQLSSASVFGQVRDALDRARLQQRPPWDELHRLASGLGLPEIGDLADIMALDEQGAALVDALRARVRELRKAHLAAAQLAAQKHAEGMTVWMVAPVLVFALIFLIPPIMTMLSGM